LRAPLPHVRKHAKLALGQRILDVRDVGVEVFMQDKLEVMISEVEIQTAVKLLGEKISADYADKNLVFFGVLNGVFIFLADLVRNVTVPCQINFLCVKSYGGGTIPGELQFLLDAPEDLSGKDIILVDDILDTGTTLSRVKAHLFSRNPNSIRVCAFLDKPERRRVALHADYVGITIPDAFAVGYGLDYDEKYRSLPYIARIAAEDK
jgi:hypoxanthine phosphoribosyltransferase